MPRPKGSVNKAKVETTDVFPEEENIKEEMISLLKVEIPKLFDRTPTGSLSQTGLEELTNKILEINN